MEGERKAALLAELKALNDAAEAAIYARRQWMDAHMAEFCKFAIADPIYDGRTGARLGTVTEHYRYWADRDPRYDTTMDVHVQYLIDGKSHCYDNTSCQIGASFATKGEAEQNFKRRTA